MEKILKNLKIYFVISIYNEVEYGSKNLKNKT